MQMPQDAKTQLDSLAPHVAQHEQELELLTARVDEVDAQFAASSSTLRQDSEAAPPPETAPRSGEPPSKDPPDPATLRSELDRIRRSISTHQALIALGRDERVGAALADVAADRELARLAATNPVGFAAERGIAVPESMRLDMLVDDQSMSLRITNLDPDAPFVLVWTPDGFHPPVE